MESTVVDIYRKVCCVRGYQVYHGIWEAAVGEVLSCEQEPRNRVDRYAVVVKKNGTVIGHIRRRMRCVCSLFLRRGGDIHCTVTGRRRYSSDLPQGGLERARDSVRRSKIYFVFLIFVVEGTPENILTKKIS